MHVYNTIIYNIISFRLYFSPHSRHGVNEMILYNNIMSSFGSVHDLTLNLAAFLWRTRKIKLGDHECYLRDDFTYLHASHKHEVRKNYYYRITL